MSSESLQTLGVVERLFPLILSGEKTSTIRWRETRMEPGYMRYVCDGDPAKTCIVLVTQCTDMPLSDAATFMGREAEWPPKFMLAAMKEHYPAIELDDVVQIVEHLAPEASSRGKDFPG